MKHWPDFKNERVILPAVLTPFDAAGKINEKALAALVSKLIDEGVDGLFPCGSTAEVFLLSRKERKRALEVVMDAASGRVPVIAHIGSTAPMDAIRLAKHAASLGVDAISAVPPFYYKYTPDELTDFFFSLSDAANLPLLVYSIEIYTGVAFTMDAYQRLFEDERILGLKHTNHNIGALHEIKRRCPDKLALMGHEEGLLGALAMGADGAIGSTYNAVAPLAMRIRDLFSKADMTGALDLQNELSAFCRSINAAGGTRALKWAVTLGGIDAGPCRAPNAPIEEDGKRIVEQALARVEVLI